MASGNSREKLGRTGRSARHRMVVRTESLRIPNWHDTGSTSPRSVGEVALIGDTISHYSRVLIAPLAIISSRRHVQKKIIQACAVSFRGHGYRKSRQWFASCATRLQEEPRAPRAPGYRIILLSFEDAQRLETLENFH